ncbi:glycosyltransferase family 4 protein [Subtercola frigoramans]|uniref:D-inositol 3-phosphate glycosyltransferase n=1 Tax=Subtercola frigoramans TaxID=120298 RepID=A0ABS2LA17_9MICO|nr:glycosyltransferase family 4 protein [Subtercola frigoramans]MBM7473296.1 glycosyltransferase involved in cell wall biosynthesis [Subtercola frigoramans]
MTESYDIVFAVNYYAPYVSGLTEVVRIVAEESAKAGRRVLVIAGRHDSSLPRTEMLNGVDVIRTPVVATIGKGLVSPTFITTVIRYGRNAGVVNLHMPMIESGAIALGLGSVPLVCTYQCDIALPAGAFNRLQTAVMDVSNRTAMSRSAVIVPSSLDYAHESRLRRWMPDAKLVAIAPPTHAFPRVEATFRETTGLHVGFLGRLVEEKGLESLVAGFRQLPDADARLLIGGDYLKIAGGSVVERVREQMGDDPRIRLLGFLPDAQLPNFYSSLDVFALPSVNSFEAFGIVQVEAMKAGVPSLASDLPGVRTPVEVTGFGRIVPRNNPGAIAAALRDLQNSPPDRVAGAAASNAMYSLEKTIGEYLGAFDSVSRRRRG